MVEQECFSGMCFVAATTSSPDAAAELLAEAAELSHRFAADRLAKAVVITQKLATKTLNQLEDTHAAF
jgi:hypothetical protein